MKTADRSPHIPPKRITQHRSQEIMPVKPLKRIQRISFAIVVKIFRPVSTLQRCPYRSPGDPRDREYKMFKSLVILSAGDEARIQVREDHIGKGGGPDPPSIGIDEENRKAIRRLLDLLFSLQQPLSEILIQCQGRWRRRYVGLPYGMVVIIDADRDDEGGDNDQQYKVNSCPEAYPDQEREQE